MKWRSDRFEFGNSFLGKSIYVRKWPEGKRFWLSAQQIATLTGHLRYIDAARLTEEERTGAKSYLFERTAMAVLDPDTALNSTFFSKSSEALMDNLLFVFRNQSASAILTGENKDAEIIALLDNLMVARIKSTGDIVIFNTNTGAAKKMNGLSLDMTREMLAKVELHGMGRRPGIVKDVRQRLLLRMADYVFQQDEQRLGDMFSNISFTVYSEFEAADPASQIVPNEHNVP